MVVIIPQAIQAEQPSSSYWFPQDLLEWTPESDGDAVYNRSMIPLADRETGHAVNDNAQSEANLVALSSMNQATSGVPSQGGNTFESNTFSYWQYVDLMVYWAGSAGEGIIVPPSADIIDAAHKNGVPILGNVFFPPTVYGGQLGWFDEMLVQDENGNFTAADKLLEVAQYYGFDGWFINQETEGATSAQAKKMQEFLIYLQDNKPEGSHIMWYDSMVESGQIAWQNALTSKNDTYLQDGDKRVADSMFLNFWWNNQQASGQKAKDINRSPYDLYAGIDVEANGVNTTDIAWEGIFPQNGSPYTSLGIYRPDWAYKEKTSMEDFYAKEHLFWVGQNGDPSDTANNGSWKGMAHYFTANTPINSLPFVTHFNTGSGKFFAIDGNVERDLEWHNRSLQDILPTWRWIKEGSQGLEVDFDWTTAYYGGTSLKVSGSLEQNGSTNIPLYKTNIKVQEDTQLSLAYQHNSEDVDMKVGISFTDSPETYTYLTVSEGSSEASEEWKQAFIDLSSYKNKHIAAISLQFSSTNGVENYIANIGELQLYNQNSKTTPSEVQHVKIEKEMFTDGTYGEIALSWEDANNDMVSHYEVYRVMADGSRQWVGATPNDVYYLANLLRDGKEATSVFEVIAVSATYEKSNAQSVELTWPAYPTPTADFNVNKTLAAPGEEIQFLNLSSEVTEEVTWYFTGATTETSTEQNPVVTYDTEGTYSVKLVAKNSEGEDELMKDGLITISKDAVNITNIALNKSASANGACNQGEVAAFAVDGTLGKKWCAHVTPQWLQIDLGQSYDIAKFVIHHAEAGGESAGFNTKIFNIEVSMDGENWSKVVDVDNNVLGVSEHNIALTEAQYVRFNIIKPTQGGDQAARIYEFEVFGL